MFFVFYFTRGAASSPNLSFDKNTSFPVLSLFRWSLCASFVTKYSHKKPLWLTICAGCTVLARPFGASRVGLCLNRGGRWEDIETRDVPRIQLTHTNSNEDFITTDFESVHSALVTGVA